MTICIIQAHEASKRLPDKVLLKINNKTILEHVYQRCNKSNASFTIVATTHNSHRIIKLCESQDIPYFIGSESDVLDRYFHCATKYRASNVIRVTSDCPVIDPKVINTLLTIHRSKKYEVSTNAKLGQETYPDGMDVTILKYSVLQEFWEKATGKHREHVVTYYTEDPTKYKIYHQKCFKDLSNIRLTVDYQDDYELIKKLYTFNKSEYFGLKEIIKMYDRYPNLFENNHKRNEGYYNGKTKLRLQNKTK